MSGQTLFFPAKHKWLADIISLRTPEEAREAVRKLKKIFNESGHSKRVLILRAVVLAANRAEAARKKKNLSAKEKKEFREIEKIYRNFAEWCEGRL